MPDRPRDQRPDRPSGQDTVWRALHVYYYEQADGLLLDGLAPVTARLRESGTVRASFFLRYWMGGPHVRWRVLVAPEAAEQVVGQVCAAAEDHLRRCPSRLAIDTDAYRDGSRLLATHEGETAPDELVPDNTVRAAPYHPEHPKYGGTAGTRIAEDLFDASSTVILRALGEIRAAQARRLGVGYLMLLAGARAAGLDGADLVGFLARYQRFWTRYAPEELSAGWPTGLTRQRDALLPATEAVLARPVDGSGWGHPAGEWMAAVHRAWARIEQQSDQVLSEVTIAGPDASRVDRRGLLLLNHLHTHHNRLGLLPAQEAYLAYLAHHFVRTVLGHSGDDHPGTALLRTGDDR